ncbi:hypothetical protein ABPG75_011589 [Micractinium tetrahymenae]
MPPLSAAHLRRSPRRSVLSPRSLAITLAPELSDGWSPGCERGSPLRTAMRVPPFLALLLLCGLGLAAASPAGGRRLAAAGSCLPSATNCTCTAEAGVEYVGGDPKAPNGELLTAVIGIEDCCLGCATLAACAAWTVKEGRCYFKAATGWFAQPSNATSGTVATKVTPPVVEPSPAPAMSPQPGASPGMSPAGVAAPSPAPAPGASPPPAAVLPGTRPPPSAVLPVATPPPVVVPAVAGCVPGVNGTCTCYEEPNVELQGGDLMAPNGDLMTAAGWVWATAATAAPRCRAAWPSRSRKASATSRPPAAGPR